MKITPTLLALLLPASILLAAPPTEQDVFISPMLPEEMGISPTTALIPEAINTLLNTAWDYPLTLISPDNTATDVSTCKALTDAINSGYQPESEFHGKYIYWRHNHCQAVSYIGQMKRFNTSYIRDLVLDSSLPAIAPPALALIISNDDIRKSHQVATWAEMSTMTRIDINNSEQSIYHDDSGGIQTVTLMARGDYNGDHIEDVLLFFDNNVEGGSYQSQDAFILTRTAPDAPLALLKSLHPLPDISN